MYFVSWLLILVWLLQTVCIVRTIYTLLVIALVIYIGQVGPSLIINRIIRFCVRYSEKLRVLNCLFLMRCGTLCRIVNILLLFVFQSGRSWRHSVWVQCVEWSGQVWKCVWWFFWKVCDIFVSTWSGMQKSGFKQNCRQPGLNFSMTMKK
jgi:hypothetical protein